MLKYSYFRLKSNFPNKFLIILLNGATPTSLYSTPWHHSNRTLGADNSLSIPATPGCGESESASDCFLRSLAFLSYNRFGATCFCRSADSKKINKNKMWLWKTEDFQVSHVYMIRHADAGNNKVLCSLQQVNNETLGSYTN